MQQEGCPALPADVPEWQTPHLARALDQDAGDPPPALPSLLPPAQSPDHALTSLIAPFSAILSQATLLGVV